MTNSAVAKRLHLSNTPDATAIANLESLCRNVLEPLRALFGRPLRVTSGYRSQAVNSAVGGVPTSQHIAGEAADITVGSPEQNRRLLGLALAHPDKVLFDQIIAERCDGYGNPIWIHISYGPRNRRQAIYA